MPPTSKDEDALGRLVRLWGLGEAARYDPVLLNQQARCMAESSRAAPGVVQKARALFDNLADCRPE